MLRLCHMISHLPWHLPEVKWMENIVPPQNGSKTPQTYPICKLERHPWLFVTIAHKLFTFRCCDHFQWILHLPISLPPRYKTLMYPLPQAIANMLQSIQARLWGFLVTLQLLVLCPKWLIMAILVTGETSLDYLVFSAGNLDGH